MKARIFDKDSRGPLDVGGFVVLGLVVACVLAVWYLGLSWQQLNPGASGLAMGADFASHSMKPVLQFEGPYKGEGPAPVLVQGLKAAVTTIAYGVACISLSIVGGLFFGFFASSRFSPGPGRGLFFRMTRGLLVVMRSIHELIWAVLLLAAFGREPIIAILAMAIPYTGTLAKIFAEMVDEADAQPTGALVHLGATSTQSHIFGLLPMVGPDLLAYSFYRFECAIRSSAVLGFFGFPTLGYFIAASFENLFYGEVWTYLYVLFAVVVVVDWWSGKLRARVLG